MFEWISEQTEVLQDENEALEPLPLEIAEPLQQQLDALPNHPDDWQSLQETLEKAIRQWRADPLNNENGIAVLSSPVDTIARLLCSDLLTELDVEIQSPQFLQWSERPAASEICQKLSQAFEQEQSVELDGNNAKTEVMVIPQLEQCFLRSVDGLDGIEYLRDVLLSDRSRFWILGASEISWQYLTKVCDLNAYCTRSFSLPALTGKQLKQWLQPAIESLEISPEFQSNSLRGHFAEDGDKSLKKDYFEALSKLSGGNSRVAADLFLQSLAYSLEQAPQNDEPGNKEALTVAQGAEVAEEEICAHVKARYPNQPDLPEIHLNEEYLLYSLLLHSEMSLTDLAKSLGESPSRLCSKVQDLKRQNIIQRKFTLKLNNLYFSRIKKKLGDDNFLI